MFGADTGIVEAGGHGMHRRRFACLILEDHSAETVNVAVFAKGDGSGVVSEFGGGAHRLDAIKGDVLFVDEARKEAHGVGAAADAGRDDIGQAAGHFGELFARFDAHDVLEIAHHHREGVRADNRADGEESRVGLRHIGVKGAVDGFLEGAPTKANRYHFGTEQFHAGDVGGFLGDVDLAHVDFTLHAEIGRRSGERHAMLTGAGFGHQLGFAHVLGEERFGHTVVEFMSAGMVQVFALGVDLRAAAHVGEVLEVRDRGRAALKMLAHIAQIANELGRFGNLLIGLVDGLEMWFQNWRKLSPSVFPKETVTGRVGLQV